MVNTITLTDKYILVLHRDYSRGFNTIIQDTGDENEASTSGQLNLSQTRESIVIYLSKHFYSS